MDSITLFKKIQSAESGVATMLKNGSYLAALFLGLDARAYAILAVFIILDTITALIKVSVIYGGKHIKSSKLAGGVISKLLLLLIPLVLVWTGEGIGLNLLPVAGSALTIFILSEVYSILGNIYAIRTGKESEEFDAVSSVLRALQRLIVRVLDVEKNKIDPSDDKK